MEETRRNVYVGLFVLAGLAGLGTLIVLFGEQPTRWMQAGTFPLHVQYSQVSDIREGNLVTVRGITIGRVVRVGLLDVSRFDAGVDVLVAIESRYKIRQGSTAQTFQAILGQGRPPVEILPGPDSAPELDYGATIPGTVRGALDTIFPVGAVATIETALRQIGDAAEAATPALRELEDVLQKRSPQDVDQQGLQGNLSSAFARFDGTLKNLNEVLGDSTVKSQLRDTVANVHQMSEKGKGAVDDLKAAAGDARQMIDDARKVLAGVDEWRGKLDGQVTDITRGMMGFLDRGDQFLDYLNTLGRQVTSGQGNVGQLFMDNKLYESMTITAERLVLAVEEFRALIAEWRQGKIKVAL